jgi:predicted phosphate transport protein (TIGR00153 family)
MALFTRTTKNLIVRIDEFFDDIDLGLLVFREALKSYLDKDMEAFERHLAKVDELENKADRLQREIGNEMITHSIMPQHREDVVKLIDMLDEIIDSVKSSLIEIDIERPEIPAELYKNFLGLAETSANTGEELVPAARAFFRDPYTVREKLLKVYYFESETDKIAIDVKKKIFRDIPDIDLSRKNQLRYMVNHIESISDYAQTAADMLSGMAIKILV